MTGNTRSLIISAGGGILAAAVIFFILKTADSGDSPADTPDQPQKSGSEHRLDWLRDMRGSQKRVHRPDRNVVQPEAVEKGEFAELWQILEDKQAEDIVKESAALKLAARGGAEAIARLWDLWQAGELPSSCSWIVDMANNGTGLEAGQDAAQPRLPHVSAARIGQAVAELMNAELNVEQRRQAARLLGRAGTEEALAALSLIVSTAEDVSPELQQTAFEAIAAVDPSRAASLLASRLDEQSMEPEALVEYLEALEEDTSMAVTRLALSLLRHQDSDVRDQAAWLIALNIDEQPSLAPNVLTSLSTETSAAVRSRLYGALGGESAAEAQTILRLAQQERHAAVQISGYQALGRMAAVDTDGAAAQLFNTEVVPLLTDTALNSADFQIRFGAFVALRLANTDEARSAIQQLATEAADRRIAEAAAAAGR